MPGEKEYTELVREVVRAVEQCKASHEGTREAVNRLGSDLALLVQVQRGTNAKMDRLIELRESEQAREKAAVEARRAASASRWAVVRTVAKSTPFQVLLAGAVFALLQALGVGWVASTYFPQGVQPVQQAQP